MRLLDAVTPVRLAAGLAVGLALAAGAGQFLVERALAGAETEAGRRSAIVGLGALVASVERTGLEAEQLPAVVLAADQRDDELAAVRVIQFAGIRLVASTADRGEQAAPRRLAREEKELYDRGQALRAGVESNLTEGRAWKDVLSVETTADGLALAAPVRGEGGAVLGAVLASATPKTFEAPVELGAARLLLVVGLPALAIVALGFVVRSRLVLVVVALLGFVVALVAFSQVATSALVEGRRAVEQAIGTRIAAVGAATGVADAWAWDVNLLGVPRGLQTAAGPDLAAVDASIDTVKAKVRRNVVLVGLVGLAVAGFIGLGGAAALGRTIVTHRTAYTYVVPALAAMLLLVFLPFFYGIALSFTSQSIYTTDKPLHEIWVGFDNFVEILSDFELVRNGEDGRSINYQNFYWTLGFTVIWTVTNVAVGVTLGLALALVLNAKGLALRGVYRVLLILPWAMPNYITALIWKGMFHSQFGVINQVLQIFGADAVSWFERPFTAFLTVLSTNGWLSFPFMMVISLGALQSIPADLYEAARVDGASRWQQFRCITLPSLKPALVPAVILSVVWTFNMFNIIFLVSEGQPGGATEILITEAYKIAFEQYRYGYAAAYSTVIFLILLAYGVWQNRVSKATEAV